MAERWQRAWMQDVDDRGRATVVIDPDPEAPWPKEETSFLVRVRRPRSPQHHRLYWGHAPDRGQVHGPMAFPRTACTSG